MICEHLDNVDEKYWILYERSNEGNEGGTGKATFIIPNKRIPKKVPRTLPEPPVILVPPIITPAITIN